MQDKFENTIRKIGNTKYITAPVDMIRNGQKPNGEVMRVGEVGRAGPLVVLIIIFLLGLLFYLYFM